jgi:hypothetical protein
LGKGVEIVRKVTLRVLVTDAKDGLMVYLIEPGSDQRIPVAQVKDGVAYAGTTIPEKEGLRVV